MKMLRFWEIDFVRGLAIVFMVVFNYTFALDFLDIYKITEGWLFWWLFPRAVAGTFILLSGMAVTISYSRNKSKRRRIMRGLKIFCWGLIITAITWLFLPSGAIVFGILHLIGLSVILSIFFVGFKKLNLILGIVAIVIGFYLERFTFDFPWLLWLGLMPPSFSTLDYFPLLPWFGVFLIGMFFGNRFYKNGKRIFKIAKEPASTKPLNFLGRHSLLIYLLHQPILIAALYAFGLL